ncbi:hypothetical protein EGR_10486 [Echinococcus granulosus]|uniref:Uncharacterized protein n=1 Tax=Echinococcus granulosus TaxID=6210 RepID=W6U0K1_ECHGR|nr:hypothetical protein EGR_10486 [Echinococcus granulosus]EUB54650.1 hypothetical protein EGR_10486 [Echinococcus granulosus]
MAMFRPSSHPASYKRGTCPHSSTYANCGGNGNVICDMMISCINLFGQVRWHTCYHRYGQWHDDRISAPVGTLKDDGGNCITGWFGVDFYLAYTIADIPQPVHKICDDEQCGFCAVSK